MNAYYIKGCTNPNAVVIFGLLEGELKSLYLKYESKKGVVK